MILSPRLFSGRQTGIQNAVLPAGETKAQKESGLPEAAHEVRAGAQVQGCRGQVPVTIAQQVFRGPIPVAGAVLVRGTRWKASSWRSLRFLVRDTPQSSPITCNCSLQSGEPGLGEGHGS